MSYYRVVMDGYEIYDPMHKETDLLEPKVTESAGQAGNFTFTFPRDHIYLKNIVPYGSTIEVFEDEESVFYGRPMPFSTDIYGQKIVHCEGALAFLNDIICPENEPGILTPMSDGDYYVFLINYYNAHQDRADRKLVLGSVPTGGTVREHEWSFRSVATEIKDDVLPYTGGMILTKRVNGQTVINWISEYTELNNQPIKLGFNMLDITSEGTELYTMAIARGGEDEDGNTISMAAPAFMSSGIVQKYGNICAYLEYPEVTNEMELWTRCNNFLNSQQFSNLKFKIEAVDIHVVESSLYNQFRVAALVNVYLPDDDSVVNLPVTSIEIDIAKNTKIINTTSPEWALKKPYIKRRKAKQEVLDYLYMKDPNTGIIQAIQISGSDIITTLLPNSISVTGLGDVVDYDAIKVQQKFADGTVIEKPLSESGLKASLPDGYPLTGNDPDLTVYGTIGGMPYSASVATPKEKKKIVQFEVRPDEFIIYNIGDRLDLSKYHAIVTYEDGTEADVSSQSRWNLLDGHEINTQNTQLQAIYTESGDIFEWQAYAYLAINGMQTFTSFQTVTCKGLSRPYDTRWWSGGGTYKLTVSTADPAGFTFRDDVRKWRSVDSYMGEDGIARVVTFPRSKNGTRVHLKAESEWDITARGDLGTYHYKSAGVQVDEWDTDYYAASWMYGPNNHWRIPSYPGTPFGYNSGPSGDTPGFFTVAWRGVKYDGWYYGQDKDCEDTWS